MDPFFSDSSEVLDSFMYLSMRCKGTPRFISSKNVKPPEKRGTIDRQSGDTENKDILKYVFVLHNV